VSDHPEHEATSPEASWFEADTDSPAPRRTRRAALVVLGAALLGTAIGVGAITVDRGAVPPFRPAIHDRSLTELTRGDRGVRVKGIAHYAGLVELRSKDGAHVVYLYPLLATFQGSDAHVVVRTHRKPDAMVEYEAVVVEGIARHPRFLLPWDAWEAMVGKGFRFDEDYVLIDAFD
jgi:hypothetical protein